MERTFFATDKSRDIRGVSDVDGHRQQVADLAAAGFELSVNVAEHRIDLLAEVSCQVFPFSSRGRSRGPARRYGRLQSGTAGENINFLWISPPATCCGIASPRHLMAEAVVDEQVG